MLYPAELRNLLMYLAISGLFRAKWSDGVHEEWISALLEKRPDLTREKLARTRALMDLHAVDALVTGYEDLMDGLELPDPDDRHVLAAAIRGEANLIVTMNVRDFPTGVLGVLGIMAQHPDDFIVRLLDLAPRSVVTAAEEHRKSLKNPPKTVGEYLEGLERAGVARSAERLRSCWMEYAG